MENQIKKIANIKNTKELIAKHEFGFKKKLGQNFLIDQNILQKIIQVSGITDQDMVIEIGPGIGSLTQYLAEAAAKVVAIEYDRSLIPILEETVGDLANVSIIHADGLKIDYDQVIGTYLEGQEVMLIANLPYYITTPLIMRVLRCPLINRLTLMVQKEVADRINAKPSTKEYGSLTLAIQYYCQTEIPLIVSKNCFIPKPNVESAVLRLIRKQRHSFVEEELLFQLIKASFRQRRKTMINSIASDPELAFDKEILRRALAALGKPEAIRGEALTLADYMELTSWLFPHSK